MARDMDQERRRAWKKWAIGVAAAQAKQTRLYPEGFVAFVNREMVEIQICKGSDLGVGIAICSVTDNWDPSKGMDQAYERAVKALEDKCDSEPIRKRLEEFPGGWTKR